MLVDKPAGMTSHDVVNVARRAVGTRRIGHTGTLDPFATGLLVLLVGRATRLLPYVDGDPKVYQAVIAFGAETDTDDVTGAVVRVAEPPSADRVLAAIATLTGEISQVPPAFSAKHVGGGRAYAAARRGVAVDLPAVPVVVHAWDVRALESCRLEATITCGSGTYIRALARDLGRLSGSAAHLAVLRRVRSGAFDVSGANTVDALRAGAADIRPALDAVPGLPVRRASADEASRIVRGEAIPAGRDPGGRTTVVGDAGELLAIAERVGDRWQPRVVLAHE